MEVLYYSVFYSVCIGIWATTAVVDLHSIVYAVERTGEIDYFPVRKYLFTKALLLTIVSGVCIGMSVLAMRDTIRFEHILSPFIVMAIAGFIHNKWNPKPPSEVEYKKRIGFYAARQYKRQALEHVLGILGNFKNNLEDSPYRTPDDVFDAAIEQFKTELDNVSNYLYWDNLFLQGRSNIH